MRTASTGCYAAPVLQAPPPLSLDQAKTFRALEAARSDLGTYLRLSWPFVNPGTPFVPGWHLDAMAEHLRAVTDGHIRRLLINVGPGYSKTSLVSIAWPTWEWLQFPHYRYLCASHSQPLSEDINKQRRDLVSSTFYRQGMRPGWALTEAGVRRIANNKQGSMVAVSVGGAVTGRHGDRQIMDDPLDARGAWTAKLRDHVEWWHSVFKSRIRDGGATVLVTQRLAGSDLSGDLQDRVEDGAAPWTVLRLEERYDGGCTTVWQVPRGGAFPSERPWLSVLPTSAGGAEVTFRDPRATGEVLCPGRHDDAAVRELWAEMSAATVAAQRQQNPRRGIGSIFPLDAWRFWHHDAARAAALGCVHLPSSFDAWCGAFDTTFQGELSSDFFVGIVGASRGAYLFVHGLVHRRADFRQARTIVRDFAATWPACDRWLLEKSANGFAIYSDLREIVPGLRYVVAEKSKMQRADAVSPLTEARQVFLPHPEIAGFDVQGFLEEMADFPGGKHDDRTDGFMHLAQWHLDFRRKGDDLDLPEIRSALPEAVAGPPPGPEGLPAVRHALGLPPVVSLALRGMQRARGRALREAMRRGVPGAEEVSSRIGTPGRHPGIWAPDGDG